MKKEAGERARRWVVERTHNWINRFRRILTRWEKKAENYAAFLHFACALIAFRAAGLFGYALRTFLSRPISLWERDASKRKVFTAG